MTREEATQHVADLVEVGTFSQIVTRQDGALILSSWQSEPSAVLSTEEEAEQYILRRRVALRLRWSIEHCKRC